LKGQDFVRSCGGHGEHGIARLEDVKAKRGVSLAEEDALFCAGDGDGLLLERLDERRIGHECGWI
jgi:limonene-1,2-epoxide hydrolase